MNVTVDTVPPAVTIISPIAGITNLTSLPLIYSVSQGVATVKFDGAATGLASGGMLASLETGTHNVRIEVTDPGRQ